MSNDKVYSWFKAQMAWFDDFEFKSCGLEAQAVFINLCALARKIEAGGLVLKATGAGVKPVSIKELAYIVQTDENVVKNSLEQLKGIGYISFENDKTIKIANYESDQSLSPAEIRVKKKRFDDRLAKRRERDSLGRFDVAVKSDGVLVSKILNDLGSWNVEALQTISGIESGAKVRKAFSLMKKFREEEKAGQFSSWYFAAGLHAFSDTTVFYDVFDRLPEERKNLVSDGEKNDYKNEKDHPETPEKTPSNIEKAEERFSEVEKSDRTADLEGEDNSEVVPEVESDHTADLEGEEEEIDPEIKEKIMDLLESHVVIDVWDAYTDCLIDENENFEWGAVERAKNKNEEFLSLLDFLNKYNWKIIFNEDLLSFLEALPYNPQTDDSFDSPPTVEYSDDPVSEREEDVLEKFKGLDRSKVCSFLVQDESSKGLIKSFCNVDPTEFLKENFRLNELGVKTDISQFLKKFQNGKFYKSDEALDAMRMIIESVEEAVEESEKEKNETIAADDLPF